MEGEGEQLEAGQNCPLCTGIGQRGHLCCIGRGGDGDKLLCKNLMFLVSDY